MFSPEPNSYIIAIFKNGFTVGGLVEYWGLQGAKIMHDDGAELFIYKPLEDVVAVKVIKNRELPSHPVSPDAKISTPLTRRTSNNSFELKGSPLPEISKPNLSAPEPNLNLRTKKLAELRTEQLAHEREAVRQKMRTFTITAPTEVNYDYPTRFGAVRRAPAQTPQRPIGDFAKLRDLQRQKTK